MCAKLYAEIRIFRKVVRAGMDIVYENISDLGRFIGGPVDDSSDSVVYCGHAF